MCFKSLVSRLIPPLGLVSCSLRLSPGGVVRAWCWQQIKLIKLIIYASLQVTTTTSSLSNSSGCWKESVCCWLKGNGVLPVLGWTRQAAPAVGLRGQKPRNGTWRSSFVFASSRDKYPLAPEKPKTPVSLVWINPVLYHGKIITHSSSSHSDTEFNKPEEIALKNSQTKMGRKRIGMQASNLLAHYVWSGENYKSLKVSRKLKNSQNWWLFLK